MSTSPSIPQQTLYNPDMCQALAGGHSGSLQSSPRSGRDPLDLEAQKRWEKGGNWGAERVGLFALHPGRGEGTAASHVGP